jgi:hypothetical protein
VNLSRMRWVPKLAPQRRLNEKPLLSPPKHGLTDDQITEANMVLGAPVSHALPLGCMNN